MKLRDSKQYGQGLFINKSIFAQPGRVKVKSKQWFSLSGPQWCGIALPPPYKRRHHAHATTSGHILCHHNVPRGWMLSLVSLLLLMLVAVLYSTAMTECYPTTYAMVQEWLQFGYKVSIVVYKS